MSVVLVVDDEPLQRDIIKAILESEGYETITASSGPEALKLIDSYSPEVCLVDLKMEGMDGIEVMERALQEHFSPSMILMTAHGTVSSAVRAMKKGAIDYLTKPLEKESLMLAIERSVERARLVKENQRLKSELAGKFKIEGIVGKSESMRRTLEVMRKIAPTPATVLITGESGTGKELVARAIHYNSLRAGKPFTALNCAAIPESLFESELFGYEPGAFTGATSRREGLIEASEGGTLFLDEIGELPVTIQAKLLRAIQEKEVRRIGGRTSKSVDVRILAATNKDLQDEIKEGRFREDLYYRLAVVRIELPPLHQRVEDIAELVAYFISSYNQLYGKRVRGVHKSAMEQFLSYRWPGNIRQLSSVLERAVLLNDSGEISLDDVKDEFRSRSRSGSDEPPAVVAAPGQLHIPEEGLVFEDLERDLIFKAMERSGGVATKAAKLLGMSYKSFVYRLEKFRSGQRPD